MIVFCTEIIVADRAVKGHDSIKGSGLLTIGQPWEAAVFEGRD